MESDSKRTGFCFYVHMNEQQKKWIHVKRDTKSGHHENSLKIKMLFVTEVTVPLNLHRISQPGSGQPFAGKQLKSKISLSNWLPIWRLAGCQPQVEDRNGVAKHWHVCEKRVELLCCSKATFVFHLAHLANINELNEHATISFNFNGSNILVPWLRDLRGISSRKSASICRS